MNPVICATLSIKDTFNESDFVALVWCFFLFLRPSFMNLKNDFKCVHVSVWFNGSRSGCWRNDRFDFHIRPKRFYLTYTQTMKNIMRMKGTEPSNQCVRWFYCVLFSCYLHPFHLFIFCSVSQTHNILCTLCKYKRLNRNAFRISHRILESVIILYSIWIRTDLFVHHIFIHIFVSCRKIHTHSHILGGKKSQLKHISLVQSGKKESVYTECLLWMLKAELSNAEKSSNSTNTHVQISSFPLFHEHFSVCVCISYLSNHMYYNDATIFIHKPLGTGKWLGIGAMVCLHRTRYT